MSTTVYVVCYKSKVLKNNESTLMIRVCKDRKMKRNYPLWACYSFVSHECTYWIAGIKNTLLFLSINGIHD